MANWSSSSYRYHAFLSFRGLDTRKAFADHLYTALKSAGIHAFRDDDEIKRGADIAEELQKAILQSPVSVIVILFSKSYASSRWCLNELARIMEQHRTSGHRVLPVFYDVDPKDVRNQRGSFVEAFAKHVLKEKKDKVEEWRKALKDVANMGGMVLGDQYESQFVRQIVHEIEKMLNEWAFDVCSNVVGMPYRLQYLNSWLQDGSNDVDVAVICGVGGTGKTTVAQVAYNQNFNRFQGSSFLHVGGSLEPADILNRQRKLLSDVERTMETEGSDPIYFSSTSEGKTKIKQAVICKRVLIVFDDVTHGDQLCEIFGRWQWCCPGSKIVITTRNEHLLKDQEISHAVIEVEQVDEYELFNRCVTLDMPILWKNSGSFLM